MLLYINYFLSLFVVSSHRYDLYEIAVYKYHNVCMYGCYVMDQPYKTLNHHQLENLPNVGSSFFSPSPVTKEISYIIISVFFVSFGVLGVQRCFCLGVVVFCKGSLRVDNSWYTTMNKLLNPFQQRQNNVITFH